MIQIMREAYRFLIFNYRPDDEIYAFGFSRGGYTARSFIGFIRHAGILDVARAKAIDRAIEIYRRAPAGQTGEESGQAIRFRLLHCRSVCVSEKDREACVRLFPALSDAERAGFPQDYDPARLGIIDFRYLGVFETVRALGMPGFVPGAALLNRRYAFHNAVLTSKVAAARHAVAIDEVRSNFEPTLFGRDKLDELNALAARDPKRPFARWQEPYQKRWFPGMHNAVGGGGPWRGLADMALAWVLRGARAAGLDVRIEPGSPVYGLLRDPFGSITGSSRFDWLISPRRRPRAGAQPLVRALACGAGALACRSGHFVRSAGLPTASAGPFRQSDCRLVRCASRARRKPSAALPPGLRCKGRNPGRHRKS